MHEAAYHDTEQMSLPGTAPEAPTQGSLALKQFAAERLAQHRHRRAAVEAQEAETEARIRARRAEARGDARGAASRVRDAVTARYQQSLSYREFLAHEAEKAMERAHAEAEVAARTARAVADAQRQLLTELEQYRAEPAQPRLVEIPTPIAAAAPAPVAEPAEPVLREAPARQAAARQPEPTFFEDDFVSPAEPPALRVQMAADLSSHASAVTRRGKAGNPEISPEESAQELELLDAELAFRHSEAFEGHSLELTPIPGNLIPFPRQIVASRKVRPRLAEGPLREESEPEPQLRIFEVEPELLSYEPAAEPSSTAEWHGMVLDEPILRIEDPDAERGMMPAEVYIPVPVHAASLERRVMAMVVDGSLIALGFVAFATAFVRFAPLALSTVKLTTVGAAAAVALVAIVALYQLLFFSLSEATPGMRVARLAFCTFTDDNPSRKAIRRRLGSVLVAAAPLGLGIVWMAFDNQRLAWHDRMSRMYPREY